MRNYADYHMWWELVMLGRERGNRYVIEIQIIPRTEVLRETGDNGYRDDPHLKNNILPKIITRTDIGMFNSVPLFYFFFVSPHIFFSRIPEQYQGSCWAAHSGRWSSGTEGCQELDSACQEQFLFKWRKRLLKSSQCRVIRTSLNYL